MPKPSRIDEVVDSALTVKKLIERLKELPPRSRVVFLKDVGEETLHPTKQVMPITGIVELNQNLEPVIQSPYSPNGVAVEMTDGDDPYPGTKSLVVVLRSE